MKKNKNSNFKPKAFLARRGYTFVETIVILSILLILVSAAITAFMDMRRRSKDVSEKAVISALETAIKQYHAQYLVWPRADVFNSQTNNPFTLMKYPPSFQWGYWVGDGKDAWGIDDLGDHYLIVCPHTTASYDKGFTWDYYYSGLNAGKIIMILNSGH